MQSPKRSWETDSSLGDRVAAPPKPSKAEACELFRIVLEEDGVRCTSKGLPDVLSFDPTGRLLGAYYVTTGRRRSLRKRQWLVAQALIRAGINCAGWCPDQGFFEIECVGRRLDPLTRSPESPRR